jgi:flagellar hook-length control protein FliK
MQWQARRSLRCLLMAFRLRLRPSPARFRGKLPPSRRRMELASASEPPAGDPSTGKLRDFIDQLLLVRDQASGATPIDPATEARAEDALDALAAALGIDLPAAAPMPVAVTAAAVPTGDVLDPLDTIEGAGAPTTATTASDAADAASIASTGSATVPAAPLQPVPEAVATFAAKLGELAKAIAPKAPQLASRLEALAAKLGTGEVDMTALAALGLDPAVEPIDADLAAALERLVAPPETKPTPQPAPFATVRLALPALGTSSTAGTSQDAGTEPAAPAPASDEVKREPASSPQVRLAEQDDGPKPAAVRDGVSATFQASQNVDAQQQASTPAAAAGVAVVGPAVAADTKAMHAAYRAPVQQINMPQMAVEIVRQVEAGNSRFQIRLDPPELGRIDVKLDVDKAGNVSARMTVERAETLDLMQRDQRSLEKALAQAGLDTSKTNLEFSLRQNPFARDGQPQHQGGNGQPAFPRFGVAEADDAIPAPHVTAYRGYASAGGVNLFV